MYRATAAQTSPICGTLDMDSRQQNKIRIQKDQLKIGSILHYYGKDAPNTKWEVWRIWYSIGLRRYSHSKVFTEKDQIVLFFQNNMNNRKSVSFRHISKSPLWRLQ
jgi:hypothetical protein